MRTGCSSHQNCITTALSDAEQLCRLRGARFTPLRRRVFELIWQNHRASRAYDLLARLQQEDPRARPPTIYRALDFLTEQGLVHRIESINAFVGCNRLRDGHTHQLLICESCDTVEELYSSRLNELLISSADKRAFHVHRLTLEATGHCRQCRG